LEDNVPSITIATVLRITTKQKIDTEHVE